MRVMVSVDLVLDLAIIIELALEARRVVKTYLEVGSRALKEGARARERVQSAQVDSEGDFAEFFTIEKGLANFRAPRCRRCHSLRMPASWSNRPCRNLYRSKSRLLKGAR